ncbi:MAG: YcjX family protein [Pseudomonadota bacterium]
MSLIAEVTDGIGRAFETAQARTEAALFQPTVRLGVTGLSRAGKTVFITSLVANLLSPGRMPQFRAAADGRLLTSFLQPQPDDGLARFAYEDHRASLLGPEPVWPEGTKQISQLRLSLRIRPTGFLTGMTGPRTVHLDIVDYPGEWLLDLPLMGQTYEEWSQASLTLARSDARAEVAAPWLAAAGAVAEQAAFEESPAQALARAFTGYLRAAREAGFSGCAPGRFLLPGEMEGSPALTFAPLPVGTGEGGLRREFARRYDAYRRIVVKPFFRDHFSRIDRQIVLVDALGAIAAGPLAVEDLRVAMADILQAFRPGKNSWLSRLTGKRVEKIAFAATKADHLHHTQHQALAGIMDALLDDARRRAAYKGAATKSFAIAALRATVEQEIAHKGETLPCVRGRLPGGRDAALYAGDLPEDPAVLLAPARQGAERWLQADYELMDFQPPTTALSPGEGPPHIRLDRAVEFLIGDRLL